MGAFGGIIHRCNSSCGCCVYIPGLAMALFGTIGAATVAAGGGATIGSIGLFEAILGGGMSAIFGTGILAAACHEMKSAHQEVKHLESKEKIDVTPDVRENQSKSQIEEKQKNEPNLSVSKTIKIAQQTVKGQVDNNKSNQNKKTRNDNHNHSEQDK